MESYWFMDGNKDKFNYGIIVFEEKNEVVSGYGERGIGKVAGIKARKLGN